MRPLKETVQRHWKAFVCWLAKDELDAQEKVHREKRDYIRKEADDKCAQTEERVNKLIEKLVKLEVEFHTKPSPFVEVHAALPVSRMGYFYGPYGIDDSEKEYIAHHIGRMVEREVRYMKLVPIDR